MIVRRIGSIIARAQFEPSIIGPFVNPFYLSRKGLFDAIMSKKYRMRGRVLDIGCGRMPYKRFFTFNKYIGIEVGPFKKNSGVNVYFDGKFLPFKSETFDSVISTQVFEHVFEPDRYLGELYRILKNDGVVLLTVPFVWDEHEQPTDYARYSSFGIKHLLSNHGFKILDHTKTLADVRLIFQLINAYLYKVLHPKTGLTHLFCAMFFMAPFTLLGSLLGKILPKNQDLYLDNVVLFCKTNAEIKRV
jgi:SAM-dependent methyltransferase